MEFRQRLGSGGFAEVFEGIYEGQTVAIKRMKTMTKNPAATREAFQSEACVVGLKHPHVIQVFAVTWEPIALVIMEQVPRAQTLQSLINDRTTYAWRTYAKQLVEAVTYLHSNNLLHLDLKPANVLVNQHEQCKVIDFGCAQPRFNPSRSACQGTLAYRAPELFKGCLPTTKADIYLLAITLWSLKHQQTPYQGQNNDSLIYQVVAFHRRPSPDPEFQRLWDANPEQRPDAEQLTF